MGKLSKIIMKNILLAVSCCLFLSCGKKEVSKYPIVVSIWSSEGSYSQEFLVDSIVGKMAYKDGRKIELNKVRYIIFK